MVLPGNVSTGVVTGKLTRTNGFPSIGEARFRPAPRQVLDASANVVLTGIWQTVLLDSEGQFSIVLVATDDIDLNPVDWTWDVFIELDDQPNLSFAMEVPGGVTTDIADIIPVPASDGTFYITGPAGPPGTGALAASVPTTLAGTSTTEWVSPSSLHVQDELYDARSSPGFVDNATTDNTTAFAAGMAIVAAAAGASTTAQKAGMKLPHGHVYRGIIDVPYLCILDAKGSLIRSPASGTDPVVTLAAGAELRNASVWGSGAGFGQDGVLVAGVRAKVLDVNFEVFGGSAIVVDAGSVVIARCIAQGCLVDADTLSTPTGVLHITANANDAWIDKSEFNAVQTSAMSASGFARAIAVFGGSAQFDTVIGAFADHGWHLAGPHALLEGTRGEFNRGHGYIMLAGSSGRAIGPWSHQNGLQTTNTYDGFNVENNAAWRVTAPKVTRNSGNVMRYGIYDASNGYANFSQYDSTGHIDPSAVGTAPIFVEDASGSKVDPYQGPFIVAAAAATTIDVQQYGWPSTNDQLNSSSFVNFTGWTNGVAGQRRTVRGDGFTTFVHSASLVMRSGLNTLAQLGKMYEFVKLGANWVEVGAQQPQGVTFTNAATYTPVLTDAEKVIYTTLAGGCAVTIPPNSTHPFPLGTRIDFIRGAAGALTIAAGAGVTVVQGAPLTGAVRAQYSRATIQQITANFWVLSGDLA